MFHTFNHCLDRRLDQLAVPPEVRQGLNDQRMRLAAAEIPSAADEQTRSILKQTIDECFIAGFRRVMLVGSVLAFASSSIAWLVVRNR